MWAGGFFPRAGGAVSDPTEKNRGAQSVSSSALSTSPLKGSTSANRTQLLIRHPLSSRLERFRRELITYRQHLQTTATFQCNSFLSSSSNRLFRHTSRIDVSVQVRPSTGT